MKSKLFAALALTFLSTLDPQLSTIFAQGTAFTYQGRLHVGTNAANGLYDLRFTVHDALSDGAQQGGPLTNAATSVSNGLFTVTLNFGTGVFNGADRWLEIGTRTNGNGAFMVLAPRQPLTPTPYAIYAQSANATNLIGAIPAASLSGVAYLIGGNVFTGNQTVTNGNVGIGTNNPAEKLHVAGNILASNVVATRFIGDGSGLTGIAVTNASLLTGGTLPDARLSANVALRSGGNNFTGTQNVTNGTMIIGTTTVGPGLHVLGSGFFGNHSGGLPAGVGTGVRIFRDTVTGSGNIFAYNYGNSTATNLVLQQPGGNLGVGTTAPETKLHVGANTSPQDEYITVSTIGGNLYQAGLKLRHFNAGYGWTLESDEPTSRLRILSHFNDTNGVERVVVDRFSGNVGIGTNNPTTKLHVIGEITTTAVNLTSDRNAKEQFKPISAREVLAKVTQLPISEWQYKEHPDTRHIGPMAQDFHAAFAVGRDDKHITSVDADGVALAAIQGLNEILEEQVRDKDGRIQELERAVAELRSLVKNLALAREGVAQ